ncbi:MAG: hypothetical protein PHR35_16815 [Kiritimatiellae bacterium]|nr:hypothetical protein [Kiritimatiellia bacterium]
MIHPDHLRSIPPSFAWREQVQNRMRALLAASPLAETDLTVERWREVKEKWRRFVRKAAQALIQRDRAPLVVRSAGGYSGPGFRVENMVFESFPGWQVGLNLFLPEGAGPFIPVLCPCGHGPKWAGEHQVPPQVLARHGFAAALFDMPMFGEKWRDNCHFTQGPQAEMAGHWSNEFFLLDALRAADYLETRSDIAWAHGMGVTGVSGGGMATLFLAAIDPRVRAFVPVCSIAPLNGHIMEGLYTGCPENYMPGQVQAGLDLCDLLGLAAPLPCLAISGRQDTLFTPESIRRAMVRARRVYAIEGAADRLDEYVADAPHTYTADMAERAAGWFRRWLGVSGDVRMAEPVVVLPEATLDCGTGATTDSMLDVVRRDVVRLRSRRKPAVSNAELAGVLRLAPDERPVEVVNLPSASAWGYPGLRHRVVPTPDGLALPLIEITCPDAPVGAMVCFTEGEPLAPLRQDAGLYGLCRHMFSASLRGFGALTPAPTDYDIYSWCAVDRALSDLLAMGGETALGVQTADACRVVRAAGTEQTDGLLTVYGRGEAALPALFAGILHPRVTNVIVDRGLSSFGLLATAPRPAWRRYCFLQNVLTRFDLPELLAGRPEKRFLVLNPLDAMKRPLDESAALDLYGADTPHVTVRLQAEDEAPAPLLRAWFNREAPAARR